MVWNIFIQLIILLVTCLIKKRWAAIIGFILDLVIAVETINVGLSIIDSASTLVAIVYSPYIVFTVVLMIGSVAVTVIQGTKMKKNVVTMMDVLYESPEGKQYHTQFTREGYSNFINNAIANGYKIIHTYEVKVNK